MSRLADLAARWKALDWRADVALALIAGVSYAILGWWLWEGRPTGIDEVVSLWQARLLLHGELAAPVPPHPEAVLTRLTGIGPLGITGQFSLGTVLLLVPFVMIGQVSLAGPVFGALGIFGWSRLVRRLEPHAPTALAAVLLLGISPFWALQSTSQMVHVPVTALVFSVGVLLARLLAPTWRGSDAVWLGIVVGTAALIRPIEALVAAVPAAAIVIWAVWRGRLPVRVIRLGLLGVAGPMAILFGANTLITGSPLRFTYDVVSGPSHHLGFHASPDGTEYTPARGAMKLRRQLHGLGAASWESRLPPLWPAALGLVLAVPAMTLLEGWAVAAIAGLLVCYWAYWGNAEWLGPRFMLLVLPFMLLAVARVPRLLGRWHRLLGVAAALVIIGAVSDGLFRGAHKEFLKFAVMERPVTRDIAPLLVGTPRPGLIIARGDLKRSNEARLRAFTGTVGSTNTAVKGVDPCDVLWRVRWLEVGVPATPHVAPAWRAWCTGPEFRDRLLVSADVTGSVLLFSVPNRPIVRDLGARTAVLADISTFSTQTRLLFWERVGVEQWRSRLVVFNYDSARADWALEDSAFAAARREVGR